MNNFIKKELVGRTYWNGSRLFVILGVRKNPQYEYWLKERNISYKDYNYYEVLIGRLHTNKERTYASIEVYSWSHYGGQKRICFDCRGTRKAISRCIKLRPELIHYHTGKRINLNGANVRIWEGNTKYYSEYLQTL
jgi:hypothetical protein